MTTLSFSEKYNFFELFSGEGAVTQAWRLFAYMMIETDLQYSLHLYGSSGTTVATPQPALTNYTGPPWTSSPALAIRCLAALY